MDGTTLTKSGLMVGLGEEMNELLQTMQDIRDTECDILTIGQYLSPTSRHLPIQRYYTPEEFEELREAGMEMGFRHVESGALVRSSYHAHEHAQLMDVQGQ
jgi:lipoic acid synthetase